MDVRAAWIAKWKSELDSSSNIDKLAEIQRRYMNAREQRSEVHSEVDASCLADRQVIGMTTLICEEAGEIMEAQTISTLVPSLKHAIFIGDPLQLRPQVSQTCLSLETAHGSKYRLDESLFERMAMPRAPGAPPVPVSKLKLQRRMHPDVADLMRVTLYPFLEDHPSTSRLPIAGMAHRTFWLDHQEPEDAPDPSAAGGRSYSNAFECAMISELVRYLLNTRQLGCLKERLVSTGTCSIALSNKDKEDLADMGFLDDAEQNQFRSTVEVSRMVRLATIDGFQGEEAKVIILSTVRSNIQDRVGFLQTTNRVNVACSRARNGFYIVGNAALLRTVGMWSSIIDNFQSKGRIGRAFITHCSRHPHLAHAVSRPHQFQEQVPSSHVAIARRQSWWTLYHVDTRSPSSVLMLIMRRRGNAPSAWNQRHYPVDTQSKRLAPRRMSLYFARHSANSFISAVTHAEGNVISVRRTSSTANASVCVPSSCHAATSAQTSAITGHALHASNPASDPANMGKPVKSPVQMSAIHACKAASRHPVPTGAVRLSVPCHVAGSPAANLVSIFYRAHTSAPGFAIFLLCGHDFEVASLDAILGLADLFELSSSGEIMSLKGSTAELSKAKPQCPQCGIACDDLQRYRQLEQFKTAPETIERLFKLFGRKLAFFARKVQRDSRDLDDGFKWFRKNIELGPLAGENSAKLIKARMLFTMSTQNLVTRFRDVVVHKAEDDIAQTIGLLGDTYTAATPMLPFKCRLDLLYLHCRLVMLQEAIRIIQFVKEAHDSKFMEVLIAKLRLGILAEAEDHIDEAELLIRVCFVTLIKRLVGAGTDHLDKAESLLEQAGTLISNYPTTAGLLKSSLETVRLYWRGKKATAELWAPETQKLWETWGTFEVGSLAYCEHGHPYSSKACQCCSECERLVEVTAPEDRIDYERYLNRDKFLAHMPKTMGSQ
ncbi:MAG: hypothetical protein Q9177_000625 [Variospora cf. flavescens]